MTRLLRTAALAAAAALAALPCAAQKKGAGDALGPLSVSTTTAHPVRVVYHAAFDAAREKGFEPQILLLDEGIATAPASPEPNLPPAVVQIEFEAHGDSTGFSVVGFGVDTVARRRCSTQQCTASGLAAAVLITGGITDRLKAYTPPAPSAADSLAAAKALGYSPESPVKTGGGAEHGAEQQHAWLDGLRGPHGERVTWFRLGSCCDFETPNAPPDMQGHGRLDAYEVTYPGLPSPVLLYLDLYDGGDMLATPAGFTRPSTTPST
jgi:hypothetical protein